MKLFDGYKLRLALLALAGFLLMGGGRRVYAKSVSSHPTDLRPTTNNLSFDVEASILANGQHNSLNRDSDPVVITGDKMRTLNRLAVDRIVGFRFQDSWEQIPIQIDERKYVDFGVVYDKPPVGHGILAYTDPNTYVGPDTYPDFDADDELVFMTKDAGNLAPLSGDSPVGVLEESRVEIQIHDPLDGAVGYVYLFESDGSLAQDAGKDYVTYNFRLLRGPYIPYYNKGQGFNPEDSEIYTDAYRTHFSDRWIRDELQVFAGSATGVDILDRHKLGRDPGDCSRNENTASEGGGAFLTNKDGCVRAIRSYMGFNSAPYIQREHSFYEQQQKICTYIRAHDTVGGVRDLYDYSPDANGMLYFNDLNLNGVWVDGNPDEVNHGHINWEMVTGVQGTITVCHFLETDIPNYETFSYYGDDAFPDLIQCTGDQYQYGTSGLAYDPIPFTDPVLYPTFYNSLVFYRTDYYEPPDQTVDTASVRHQQAMAPLEVTVTALNPPPPVFVDDDAPNDEAPCDPTISDPNEDGSAEHPFDAIQEAIDYAVDGETVIVLAGSYIGDSNCDLDFKGKAITLRSQNGSSDCIIDCQYLGRGFKFHSGEGQDSVLNGFTITNAEADRGGGIYCLNGSSPTITNCTFRGNSAYGSLGRLPSAYGGGICCQSSKPRITNCTFNGNLAEDHGGGMYCEDSSPTLTNCIFWGNTPNEIYGDNVTVTYSNIQGGYVGEGNMDVDPLFADPENGDYHLKSQVGRYDPNTQTWVVDDVTSLCIDAGDPTSPIGLEPLPNGAIVNIGAYGGTSEASKSLSNG